jgi:hypothetical protein
MVQKIDTYQDFMREIAEPDFGDSWLTNPTCAGHGSALVRYFTYTIGFRAAVPIPITLVTTSSICVPR